LTIARELAGFAWSIAVVTTVDEGAPINVRARRLYVTSLA
jgi:hypothetical protein